jgi:hypothetical protein
LVTRNCGRWTEWWVAPRRAHGEEVRDSTNDVAKAFSRFGMACHAMHCQLYRGRETSMAGHGELYAMDIDE